jgi:predicted esterase
VTPDPRRDPHAAEPVLFAGAPPETARAALLLLHGRGASAESILELGEEVADETVALVAPQAAGNTWYPLSFLAPLELNEPHLSSALAKVEAVLDQIAAAGVPAERTVLAGFSQGACLASEFVARRGRRYGGLAALSGGVIGPPGAPRDDRGDLAAMPVFLGCSDADPHVPKARVEQSAEIFRRLGAEVTLRIYPAMPHTVNSDETARLRLMVDAVGGG